MVTRTKKACIDCGERIVVTARRCPNCGSFQDWRAFFEGWGQLLSLVAILLASYAAYTSSQISQQMARGIVSPNLTALQFDDNDIAFELHNTGNLNSHLQEITLEAAGVLGQHDQFEGTHTVFAWKYAPRPLLIQARGDIRKSVRLAHFKAMRMHERYTSMSSDQIVRTFFDAADDLAAKSGGAVDKENWCHINFYFTDPHGSLGARRTVSRGIDCRRFAIMIASRNGGSAP